jgi:PPM family protein phosphatase
LHVELMLDLEFAEFSDDGRSRDHNEDYLGHYSPPSAVDSRRGWLFALADGVGGQDAGEVASMTAVESLVSDFEKSPAHEPLIAVLPKLVQEANHRVYLAGAGRRAGAPSIATTVVACGVRFDRAVVAHVGDSRCYLIRRGEATQLTRDHTVVNDQVRLGLLSARQAAAAETRNLLSRCLGNDLFVNVDVSDHLLLTGDVLLLCSDGMHNSVSSADMVSAVSRSTPLPNAAQSLVKLANERDGSDNISVQLVRIRAVERVGMYRGRPYKLS